MNVVRIIQADISHTPLLAQISVQSFRETFEKDNNPDDFQLYVETAFSEEQIIKDIQEPESLFYIAHYDNEVAGYARLRNSTEVNNEFPGKKLIELHRLYALHQYIGRGIGKALMNHCLFEAKQLEFDIMWLGVWEHNHRAQGFYKNFGFEKFSSHIFMVGNDPQTDNLLKKELIK